MDIAGLSTNLSTINVVNDVQVAVLRQSLDTLETSGDSLTKMMEASVNPEFWYSYITEYFLLLLSDTLNQ